MSWVKEALESLKQGEHARVRPHGGSMRGRIESGQRVTICKADFDEIAVNDIVFVRWKGNYLLHLVVEIGDQRILIGNNVGKVNGWVEAVDVIGIVVSVEE